MKSAYHRLLVTQTLGNHFSQHALEIILEANLGQDALSGQIGHPEYHFDDSLIQKAQVYVDEQRELVFQASRGNPTQPDLTAAWQAFGRLTHAVQDFYAHSNYTILWFQAHNVDVRPERIEPLDPGVLSNPKLTSGKIYNPWELLSFISTLEPFMKFFLPRDSHAWLNIDSPDRSVFFPYAMEAARKRTIYEFEQIASQLSLEELALFKDM